MKKYIKISLYASLSALLIYGCANTALKNSDPDRYMSLWEAHNQYEEGVKQEKVAYLTKQKKQRESKRSDGLSRGKRFLLAATDITSFAIIGTLSPLYTNESLSTPSYIIEDILYDIPLN
ncbi:hypothetical protein CCZ01_03835 [Helicobacter monodelphidis]|uniref:hypothetical protein n=1 Tax=Helicobacter sp. 15-1451 TaxID=2004995 RepID=UPI000DCDE905|nr:hypothetical protein [Helicobacter sp. 15-1451]RAX58213.1 hypothetical protein CCZ01_03835 [Helicobacter sp. 15-1451]